MEGRGAEMSPTSHCLPLDYLVSANIFASSTSLTIFISEQDCRYRIRPPRVLLSAATLAVYNRYPDVQKSICRERLALCVSRSQCAISTSFCYFMALPSAPRVIPTAAFVHWLPNVIPIERDRSPKPFRYVLYCLCLFLMFIRLQNCC